MTALFPPSLPSRNIHRSANRRRVAAACVAIMGTFGLISAATVSPAGPATGPLPTLRTPIVPLRAVHLFDRPDTQWGPGHRGIDLAATVGEDVLSPGDGKVTFAGIVVDRGVVTVDHGSGFRSSVEPIIPSVEVGDHVQTSDVLGIVSDASGHCAPETCVHWGVRLGDEYVNPLDVLVGYGRIVLLP